jgi:hypothetical protein
MESDEKEFLERNIKHRYYVSFFLMKLIEDLFLRSNVHDVSKHSDEEFEGFRKSIYYLKGPWGQENRPPEILEQLNESLQIHYKRNDHHPEHFENGMEDMDLVQLLELIADWRAAMIGQDNHDIDETIATGQERFGYPDFMAKILKNTLIKIRQYELEADMHLPSL